MNGCPQNAVHNYSGLSSYVSMRKYGKHVFA